MNLPSLPSVQRAVLDLHRRAGEWPTSLEVAAYLEVPDRAAQEALLDLRRRRVMLDRYRKRGRVWMPVREARR